MNALILPEDDLCRRCECEPAGMRGFCGECQADEDLENCEFCHGTGCTRECEDVEDTS